MNGYEVVVRFYIDLEKLEPYDEIVIGLLEPEVVAASLIETLDDLNKDGGAPDYISFEVLHSEKIT